MACLKVQRPKRSECRWRDEGKGCFYLMLREVENIGRCEGMLCILSAVKNEVEELSVGRWDTEIVLGI